MAVPAFFLDGWYGAARTRTRLWPCMRHDCWFLGMLARWRLAAAIVWAAGDLYRVDVPIAVHTLVYIARRPQVSDTRRDIYCQASPGVWHEARVGQVSGTRREVDRRWARTDGPFRCREWEHGRTADALERPAAPAPAPATPPVASWPPHRQDERAAARGSASAPAWLV
jgi:hypothetical protein